MGKRISFWLCGLVLLACAEKTVAPPENLIDPKTMEEVLFDLSLLTAGKNTSVLTLDKYKWEPTSFVFKKYGIDSIQFVENDLYYASLPDIYEEIYTNIDTRLGKIKDSLEKIRNKDVELKRENKPKPKPKEEKKL